MGWLFAANVASVVLAAVGATFGLSFEDACLVVAGTTLANTLAVAVRFVEEYARAAWHPERNKDWEARATAGGPRLLTLDLVRTGDPTVVYGHRCTVRHPNGHVATAVDVEVAFMPPVGGAFRFLYSKSARDFPSDIPEPVSGSYHVTWELRLKPKGSWREVIHDRSVVVEMCS